MLSFRLFLFTVLAGICLWGLFALLDNLREPELLRSPKAVVVKGCEPMESDEARQLCPQLLCQKALLDSKQVPPNTEFTAMTEERREVEPGRISEVIVGTAQVAAPSAAQIRFECAMEKSKVSSVRLQ